MSAVLTDNTVRQEALRIAGDHVYSKQVFEVRFPYTGEVVATVPKASVEDVRRAFRIAREYKPKLTRYERYRILMRAGELIAQRREARVDEVPKPAIRDLHEAPPSSRPAAGPNCCRKRRSLSKSRRMSSISYFRIATRSTPMPNAHPVTSSGS